MTFDIHFSRRWTPIMCDNAVQFWRERGWQRTLHHSQKKLKNIDSQNEHAYNPPMSVPIRMAIAYCALALPSGFSQNVLTQAYDNSRSGANTSETILTPSTVAAGFGELFERAVDGDVQAQVLYLRNVPVPGQTSPKNLFFAATAKNKLYAFDADSTDPTPAGGLIWSRQINSTRELVIGPSTTSSEICNETFDGFVGITSTLCLGRDGLTSFLVQRKLIELFPERYRLIDPRDIRYISVSRQLVMQSSDALLKAYLHRNGVSQYQSISVIDFALSGSIQNRLHILYPENNISGRYLLAHRLWGDAFGSRKTGFLVETDGGTFCGLSGALHITDGKLGASLTQVFLGSDFVHFFEAIWNGIYESTTHLVDGAGIVRVANSGAKIFATPGTACEIAGIADHSIYLAFKKIALRGIVDGVVVYRRRQQLGLIDSTENAIHRLAEWFMRFKWHDGLDRRVVKALAPAFFNAPIALDSGGTPDDVSGALSDYQILGALMYGYRPHPQPRLANYDFSI